jgi:hypothetical protein
MPLLDAADADAEAQRIIEGMLARRPKSPDRQKSPDHQHRHKKKLAQGRKRGPNPIPTEEEEDEEVPVKEKDLVKVEQPAAAPHDPLAHRKPLAATEDEPPPPGLLARLMWWRRAAPAAPAAPVAVHRRINPRAAADARDPGAAALFDRRFDWTACRCQKGCGSGLGKCPQQYPGLPDRCAGRAMAAAALELRLGGEIGMEQEGEESGEGGGRMGEEGRKCRHVS